MTGINIKSWEIPENELNKKLKHINSFTSILLAHIEPVVYYQALPDPSRRIPFFRG